MTDKLNQALDRIEAAECVELEPHETSLTLFGLAKI
jgi:hypothetical protein